MPDERQRAAARLRVALELSDSGVALMRQNLRRRHPSDSEEQIDSRLTDWLERPRGAEYGDAEGRVVPWPRT